MKNIINAVNQNTNQNCYLNLNFVVDIYSYGKDNYIAFTDTRRNCGYLIKREDFDNFLKEENNGQNN